MRKKELEKINDKLDFLNRDNQKITKELDRILIDRKYGINKKDLLNRIEILEKELEEMRENNKIVVSEKEYYGLLKENESMRITLNQFGIFKDIRIIPGSIYVNKHEVSGIGGSDRIEHKITLGFEEYI